MSRSAFIVLCMVLTGSFATGCATYTSATYEPRPARVDAPLPGADENHRVSGLATVLGVRRRDEQPRNVVDVRLRLENQSDQTVGFDPHTLVLLDGRLQPFGQPILSPSQPIDIEPGGSATVDAAFGFPADLDTDQIDLSSLSLRWSVSSQRGTMAYSTVFRREEPYDGYYYRRHYHPFYGPRFGYYDRYWYPRSAWWDDYYW